MQQRRGKHALSPLSFDAVANWNTSLRKLAMSLAGFCRTVDAVPNWNTLLRKLAKNLSGRDVTVDKMLNCCS